MRKHFQQAAVSQKIGNRCPSASHSDGLPGGNLPVHRLRCEAIEDDFAADGSTQIFNLLCIGTVGSYCSSWVRSLGIAHDYFL